ncbi:hypothetical protein HU200_023714 [Digitaria exilis]|uniref:Endonuclease/exonuclease/phosphatase domain-containing protein n=1 Tax=Digitaria exilis TaxID=1010633 RepID=A0A835C4B2_9POAL|nr:hypothetical protein HU200_023714 [Digitaria exilis]
MASRSRSPPPSPDELKWACGACAVLNSNSCEACETRRPLEVDADSPIFVGDASASASLQARGRKRDVAEAERPVEVDADSPIVAADASASPPLKACGRKRECDPAVSVADRPVEVDADSPVVVATTPASALRRRRRKKKDRAPAVAEEERPVEVDASASPPLRVRGGKRKRGNLGIHLGKTFKIMTYNIWFREDMELSRRMDAIGDLIKHHNPDLICFQEVTPFIYLLMQKSEWWQRYKCLLSQEAILKPYFCMQLSKVPVEPSECIPFHNSIILRELCIATVSTGEITNLVVATTHLESPCPAPPKWDQMYSKERVDQAKKSLEILGGCRNAILCGDLNWDDKGDGPFPLQDGWIDAWVELKPGDDGWTYDTKANGMLSGNRKLQKRMDRFLCKLEDFKIDNIEMIGKEAIPGISYFKDKKVRKEIQTIQLPVFPSDHFGLVLTITKQGG